MGLRAAALSNVTVPGPLTTLQFAVTVQVGRQMSVQREKVRFVSGDNECAAWHYPGTNGACVIMAGGFALTKEPATDMFAQRFSHAGYTVLAFDYRRLGESSGLPRLVQPVRDMLADWQAAIGFARMLPGVDPGVVDLYPGTAEVERSQTIFTQETRDAVAEARLWYKGWWNL